MAHCLVNKWRLSKPRQAIELYLVKKHGWTIDYCRTLRDDDIYLSLHEEMKGWKISDELEAIPKLLDPILEKSKKK